jgi:hypothetical protein
MDLSVQVRQPIREFCGSSPQNSSSVSAEIRFEFSSPHFRMIRRLGCSLILLCCVAVAAAADRRPNIVLIMGR